MPDWQAQALIDLQDYYVHGYGGECNDEIRRVAGHLPRTFDSFVENAAAFGNERVPHEYSTTAPADRN